MLFIILVKIINTRLNRIITSKNEIFIKGVLITMKRETVIYIGGFELPDKNAAAHRVLSNGKIIREMGYEVVFLDVDHSLNYTHLDTKRKKVQGFEVYSAPYPMKKTQWIDYLSNTQRIINLIDKYPNVKAIICYNYPSFALKKIQTFCNKNNIKLVADCTEWYSVKGNSLPFKFIKGIDSFYRMRKVQKNVDGVIAISKYLENYYSKYTETVYLPPLVDLTEKKWEENKSFSNKDLIKFVYAGSPGKNKDKLNIIIEALYELGKFDAFEFLVVGITKKQYLEINSKHKKIIEELNPQVKFLGRVSHVESLKHIKNSDFTIFIRENTLTNKAGFPTKFVESMSCGTPVITSKSSDLEQYLIEGENGFFINLNDRKQFMNELAEILKLNRNEILKMKKNTLSLQTFNYSNYIENMKAFLNNL